MVTSYDETANLLIDRITMELLLEDLTPKERDTLHFWLNGGYSRQEIADIIKVRYGDPKVDGKMDYQDVITWISRKYSGDFDLAEDVVQEVMLRLFEDRRLDIAKFNPAKKDAAIRQTIRNKVLKVLKSRKVGRWSVDSLDKLKEEGYQIDTSGNLMKDPILFQKRFLEEDHDDR